MDLARLIRLAIVASIVLLVFALGLRATVADATIARKIFATRSRRT